MRARDLFTASIAVVLAGAIINAWSWPLRASIIILVLGSIGLIMVVAQLVLDYCRADGEVASKLDYEIPSFQDTDSKTSQRGAMVMWGWLFGLLIAIKLIGLPIALPLFVFAYARFYGAKWLIAIILASLIAGFEYAVYERIIHVYWPDPLIMELFR